MLAVVTQINGEDCTLPFHAGICMTRVAKKSRVATFQGRPPRPFLPLTKRPCLFKVSFNKVAARTLCEQEASALLSFPHAQRNRYVVVLERLTK